MAQRKQKTSQAVQVIGIIGRIVLLLFLFSVIMAISGMSSLYQAYAQARDNLEQVVEGGDVPQSTQSTRVYARDFDPQTGAGTLLARLFQDENRLNADYEDIPAELIACLISTEDHRFFEHKGVDTLGLARAIFDGIKSGGNFKGTSTITQQLARNVFLPYIKSERTMNRKIQEAIYSFALEERQTKEQILQQYLNHIYLGGGAWGVMTASAVYFDKQLDELTLAECALLAGLPQTPSKDNPYENLDNAIERRNHVLRLLKSRLDEGFLEELADYDQAKFGGLSISSDDIGRALDEEIHLEPKSQPDYLKFPYFTDYVRFHVLFPRYGQERVLRDGMVVVTTLDPLYQQWAEEIVAEGIDEYRDSKRVSQGALVLIENATGEVLACVGGYGWGTPGRNGEPDKYNRAMQDGRPVGSAFKPFTYATAYEQGFSPTMTIWDGPNQLYTKKMGTYWPRNSDQTYRGWVSTFWALQLSRNAASVDLAVNCTGIPPIIETARRMGITKRLDEVPALTLGVASIPPVQMAEAFSTFPNAGGHIRHETLRKVYTSELQIKDDYTAAGAMRTNQAFSQNTAWMMVQNMRRVVEAGTGTRARVSGVQIAGKTGTNDDFADAWFVGYSPELTLAVWVGNDDYSLQMKRMYGGDLPAEIFKKLMTRIYTKQTEVSGEGDAAVETVIYEPRYTQLEFVKPPEATFNGFSGAVVGAVLQKDEEGNLVVPVPEKDPEEEAAEASPENPDDEFYRSWDPPPHTGGAFF